MRGLLQLGNDGNHANLTNRAGQGGLVAVTHGGRS